MTLIRLRRGTAAAWTSANPILAAGEPGVELDTGFEKIGDGTLHWNDLGYTKGATSGASVPISAYATWGRTAPFESNFSFDWEADQTHEDANGFIVLDTSPEWADPDTGASGHPAPKVTVAGSYLFLAHLDGPTLTQAGDFAQGAFILLLEDITGMQCVPGVLDNTLSYRQSEVYPTTLPLSMTFALTVNLPVGTHFEFKVLTYAIVGGAPANNHADFVLKSTIKRLA